MSRDRDNSISSLTRCFIFLIFSCLIALSQFSHTVLSRSCENVHLCVCLDFEVKSFTTENGASCRFSQVPFIILRELPSLPGLRAF